MSPGALPGPAPVRVTMSCRRRLRSPLLRSAPSSPRTLRESPARLRGRSAQAGFPARAIVLPAGRGAPLLVAEWVRNSYCRSCKAFAESLRASVSGGCHTLCILGHESQPRPAELSEASCSIHSLAAALGRPVRALRAPGTECIAQLAGAAAGRRALAPARGGVRRGGRPGRAARRASRGPAPRNSRRRARAGSVGTRLPRAGNYGATGATARRCARASARLIRGSVRAGISAMRCAWPGARTRAVGQRPGPLAERAAGRSEGASSLTSIPGLQGRERETKRVLPDPDEMGRSEGSGG